MDGVSRRNRRWGADETEKCYDNKRILVGDGRMEEGIENDPERVEKGGAVEARISVKH